MMNAEKAAAIHPADWNFRFRSGRLCLDFIATVGDREHLAFDRWRTDHDFSRWCLDAQLIPREIDISNDQVTAARRLREALFRLVTSALTHGAPNPADLHILNEAARKPPLIPELTRIGESCTWISTTPYDAVLATVARDAVDLLSGSTWERIRKCADTQCSILFVDTSRPGKRRWCSMKGCGNKVKKAAYRKRQRV